MADEPGEGSIDATVLQAASAALGVELTDPQRLPSPNTVFRAQRADGGSVIVKRITMTEWNRGDGAESEQLLNEWCSLEHLRGEVAPRLLASDRSASLIVLEDFGRHQTVEEALLDPTTPDGERLLYEAGAALARMHEVGVGRETEFLERQRMLRTTSPYSDSTVDFRVDRRDLFEDAFVSTGTFVHPGFWTDVERLEQAVHDESAYRTMIHADAGPQNFLPADSMRMIDFEFGIYLNAMCDVGGARVGFPQTSEAAWVRREHSALFEAGYRETASSFWPEVEDVAFEEHLLMGAGHWALNRLAGGWRSGLRDMFMGEQAPDDSGDVGRHYTTLWTLFCESADEADVLQPISSTIRSFLENFGERVPGMTPLAEYPALDS